MKSGLATSTYRTAPAKPGLLKVYTICPYMLFSVDGEMKQ